MSFWHFHNTFSLQHLSSLLSIMNVIRLTLMFYCITVKITLLICNNVLYIFTLLDWPRVLIVKQMKMKGTVHWKILFFFFMFLFYPHVVPNLYELLSSAEHKKIIWRILVTKEFLVAIDSHSIFGKSMAIWNIFQMIFLCVQQRKWTHRGLRMNNMRASKLWHFSIFGRTIPLR